MPDLLDPLGAAGAADAILGDEAWVRACVEVEVALMHALATEELVPLGSTAVADALMHAQLDVDVIAAASRGGGNPVIPLVKALGPVAEAA